jgi:hypothetical protein
MPTPRAPRCATRGLYKWLTGSPPFEGSFAEIATQHLFASPPSLRSKVSAISEVVEQVVLRALSKDPKDRFPTVSTFAQALEQASQGVFPFLAPTQMGEPSLFTELSPQRFFAPTQIALSDQQHPLPVTPPSTLSHRPRKGCMILIATVLVTILALVLGGVASASLLLGRSGSGARSSSSAQGNENPSGATSTDISVFPTTTPTPTDTPVPTATPLPLTFRDSLLNGNVNRWPSGSNCFFGSDGYHVIGGTNGWLCNAPFRQVDNASVAVTMKQLQRATNYGYGISFHVQGNVNEHYDFSIQSNGYWFVSKWRGNTYTYTVPATSSTAIYTGLGVTNTLNVIFQGSHFDGLPLQWWYPRDAQRDAPCAESFLQAPSGHTPGVAMTHVRPLSGNRERFSSARWTRQKHAPGMWKKSTRDRNRTEPSVPARFHLVAHPVGFPVMLQKAEWPWESLRSNVDTHTQNTDQAHMAFVSLGPSKWDRRFEDLSEPSHEPNLTLRRGSRNGQRLPFQRAFNGFTEIFTHLPSIRTVNRLWCSLCGSIGRGPTAIPAYSLNVRMHLQPFFHTFCFPVREKITETV